MDLLRFTTAGSVDDGKSTLIGRLFYDSKLIFEDQLREIQVTTQRRGKEDLDLSLLTDGLKAEREQGITIDVAYRYFTTPKRKFIIADTPGHEQYTRNMVTGASNSDLALILVDAQKGVSRQSRRHASIAALLNIPHLVICVNKMDLVDYREEAFNQIVADFQEFAEKFEITDLTYIPISALKGDNIVDKSEQMPWYQGSTLLYHLENVTIRTTKNLVDFRFPVQTVIRPHQNFRGFAGRLASGSIRAGENVLSLPSKKSSKVRSIESFDGQRTQAAAGESVTLCLEDEIDVSRGDMLVRQKNQPSCHTRLDAVVSWMHETPSQLQHRYLLRHTTREVVAHITETTYRLNIDSLHREERESLELNDIGRIQIETAEPLFFDSYRVNRATGSFILIDPHTHDTVAAGMIRGVGNENAKKIKDDNQDKSPNVVWEGFHIKREDREVKNQHRSMVIWLTGLSASGKSTIAKNVESQLFDEGYQTVLLDGDNMRHGLCKDLGFTHEDRTENIRRVGETARLFFEQGNIVLCSFISPYQKDRDFARSLLPEGRFFEVFVDVNLETAKKRDPKGLYQKAMRGEIKDFTGVDAPYEKPHTPELVLNSQTAESEVLAENLLNVIRKASQL